MVVVVGRGGAGGGGREERLHGIQICGGFKKRQINDTKKGENIKIFLSSQQTPFVTGNKYFVKPKKY